MITIAVTPITTTLLVAIRLGTVLLFSPIEAIRLIPIHARLILILTLSVFFVTNLSLSTTSSDGLSLVLSSLAEFANGLILVLSLYAVFAVFQIAGQLIDTQIGLNALALFNPADHSHDSLSSRFLVMLAVLFFFALDDHHKLIQGIAFSFTLIAPGELALFHGVVPIIQLFSLMFSFGFIIASPIVFSVLIIDVSAAVLTRSMPQANTYFLILPLKIILGLFIFEFMLSCLNPIMEHAFSLCFQSWRGLMS